MHICKKKTLCPLLARCLLLHMPVSPISESSAAELTKRRIKYSLSSISHHPPQREEKRTWFLSQLPKIAPPELAWRIILVLLSPPPRTASERTKARTDDRPTIESRPSEIGWDFQRVALRITVVVSLSRYSWIPRRDKRGFAAGGR